MEAGFRARLRAAEADLAELRTLVSRGGLGLPEPRDGPEARAALIEAMQARAGAGGDRSLASAPVRRLAAVEHARLVFALMPRMPSDAVRFPDGRRTYADIGAPRSQTELCGRIEELERKVWRVAAGARSAHGDEAYRRVYGFFDAGERLATEGLHPA